MSEEIADTAPAVPPPAPGGDPVSAESPGDAPDMFGGHEFAYESHTDLFRCTRCRAYEVTVRGDDGEISQCPGDVPGEPMVLNAF